MRRDPVFTKARKLFAQTGQPSTTQLQVQFGIGYARAARIMHQLVEAGYVIAAERHPAAQKLQGRTGARLRRPVDFKPEHLTLLLSLARQISKKVGGRVDISKPLTAILSDFESRMKRA